jgi:hypothetical protein
MTNNQFCDFIGSVGLIIACVCMVACFFGVPAWIGAILGIILMGVSQVNYD